MRNRENSQRVQKGQMQNGAICLQYTKTELDISRDAFIPHNPTPSSHNSSASIITSEHQATIHRQIRSDQGFRITQLEDSFRGSMHSHWCLLPHDATGNRNDVSTFKQAQGQIATGRNNHSSPAVKGAPRFCTY